MSLCIRGIPGIGTELYAGDTSAYQYGRDGEPVPGNGGYIATGKYGGKFFPVYLSGHWDHIECGEECGAVGREAGEG